jgi:hypothetical protein
MTIRIRAASSLIFAAVLAASGSAVAQQPYPDVKGTWIGQTQFLRQGKAEHFPSPEETGLVFVEARWTLVIDRQEGNRFFTGTWGRPEGTRRDPVLGVIRADRTTSTWSTTTARSSGSWPGRTRWRCAAPRSPPSRAT